MWHSCGHCEHSVLLTTCDCLTLVYVGYLCGEQPTFDIPKFYHDSEA